MSRTVEAELTTLCYIEQDNQYLMMHRVKKAHDINEGKWIGVGGHFIQNESPEDCLLRETREETGLTLTSWKLRGVITFLSERPDRQPESLGRRPHISAPSHGRCTLLLPETSVRHRR